MSEHKQGQSAEPQRVEHGASLPTSMLFAEVTPYGKWITDKCADDPAYLTTTREYERAEAYATYCRQEWAKEHNAAADRLAEAARAVRAELDAIVQRMESSGPPTGVPNNPQIQAAVRVVNEKAAYLRRQLTIFDAALAAYDQARGSK